MNDAQRLVSHAEPDGDCFLWTGARAQSHSLQYGHGWFAGRQMRAHRAAYILANGNIPEGLTVDHLCGRPLCVNPFHLEAVTNAENIRRGNSPTAILSRRGVCKRGHLLLSRTRSRACAVCQHDRDAVRVRSKSGRRW